MTTRGIEDQYEAEEEELDEMFKIADEMENAMFGKDILLSISAMSMLIVEAVHQIDMPEEERIKMLQHSITAAWTDYHSFPKSEDLH